jgi:riboflavin kinase/FMN adenylyltransferase
MVITFDPHPVKMLKPEVDCPVIMSLSHRLRCFEAMAIEEALVIHFNKAFSRMTREVFLKNLLIKKLGMKSLCVGHDFCFGQGGHGDVAYLKREAKNLGFSLRVVNALRDGREIISSTRIRQLIVGGAIPKASKMLGRPLSVYGTVIRGRGRGRTLGFPTANLNPHHETLPPSGVYAAWGYLGRRKLKGIIHIGKRPTFKDKQASLEVHFLNFNESIYGRDIELIFVKRLRSTQFFKSPEALKSAIQRDRAQALIALKA